MNTQIKTQEQVTTAIQNWAEQYSNLKFSQEIELINLKTQFKQDFEYLKQDLKEAYVSKQLIEHHRSQYDKKLKINSNFMKEIAKSDDDLPELLFNNIMMEFNGNINTNNQYYKDLYLNAKEQILKYYTKFFEMRSAINKLKQTQKIELNKLTQEIKDDGVAFYMITSLYSAIRANLRAKDKSPKEYDYYMKIYNSMNDKILNNMETIRKETLVDTKAKINVKIDKDEAIKRIEYIKYCINNKNYDILKEEWQKSEDKYFIIDLISKINDVNQAIEYYEKMYGEVNDMKEEGILKSLNVPGIRLNKNHIYQIKDINFN